MICKTQIAKLTPVKLTIYIVTQFHKPQCEKFSLYVFNLKAIMFLQI